ncbi:MAG: peptidylprolyl isomerase, partial [Bacteriovoracales bacterium]
GEIEIKFYPKEAPLSVTRILDLISMGFYNGVIFHRVIPNFIIQTGDPTGTGDGGSGIKLNAEFNNVPHIKGTVALARGKELDSGDSQFYISLTSLPHLDGKNTVIGQVVSGLDLLNKINMGDEIISFSIKKK